MLLSPFLLYLIVGYSNLNLELPTLQLSLTEIMQNAHGNDAEQLFRFPCFVFEYAFEWAYSNKLVLLLFVQICVTNYF